MKIALFNNSQDNVPKIKTCEWDRLVDFLTKIEVREEKDGKAFSLVEYYSTENSKFIEKQFDKKENWVSSVYSTQDGEEVICNPAGAIIRKKQNIEFAVALAYDVDGTMNVNDAKDKLGNIFYIIYSSFSNTDKVQKYRIIIPLKEKISADKYPLYWSSAVSQFGLNVDPSCKDISRLFFCFSTNKENEKYSFHFVNKGDFAQIKLEQPKQTIQQPTVARVTTGRRGDYSTLNVVEWFKSKGLYLKQTADANKHYVVCPYKHEHTDGKSGITDTVIYTDNVSNWPTFACSHSHCRYRTIKDLFELWGDQDKFCGRTYDKAEPPPKPAAKKEKPEAVYVKCLGIDDAGRYYYQSSKTSMITPLFPQQHTEKGFFSVMADEDFWLQRYGKETKKEGLIIDWAKASLELMAKSQEIGYYDAVEIRGIGVWRDQGKVVIHNGKELTVDGEKQSLTMFEGDYNYEPKSKAIILPKALFQEDAYRLREIIDKLPIPCEIDRMLLAGAIVAGPICGILQWRPHIWLVGEAGSGKSSIMSKLINRMWSPIGGINVEGGSTEAGIRQKIKNNGVPVVIDEMEALGMKNVERIQEILSMVRSSSSDTNAEVLKGTVNGKGSAFRVKSMFCLGSIVHSLKNNQDKDRFSVIRVEKDPEKMESWPKTEREIEQLITDRYACAMMQRTINSLPMLLKNIENLKTIIIEKNFSRRYADQISILLAGALILESENVLPEDVLRERFESLGDWDKYQEDRIRPYEDCIYRMLSGQIYDGRVPKTVNELINDVVLDQSVSAGRALRTNGFIVEQNKLFVASPNFYPAQEFFEKRQIYSYWDTLKDVRGVDSSGTRSFIGNKVRCLTIDLSLLGIDMAKVHGQN